MGRIVMPEVGQRWRLKSQLTAAVYDGKNSVKILERCPGRVVLEMPWSLRGRAGKSLDTFLKLYEHIEEG